MVTKNSKVQVLDTNVLLFDQNAIEVLGDNIIVIPLVVIAELDGLKNRDGNVGMAARAVSKKIDSYLNKGKEKGETLKRGVTTNSGGKLIVDVDVAKWEDLPVELERKPDYVILLSALAKKKAYKRKKVVLISKDTNLRIAGDACGLDVEDYEHGKAVSRIDELYTGIIEFEITDEEANIFLQELPRTWQCQVDCLKNFNLDNLLPNQCCVIKYKHKVVLAIYKGRGKFVYVDKPKQNSDEKKIRPINVGQCFAASMLNDTSISLVTLAGKAGTGKTLIALMAGIDQVPHNYKKILVWRPMVKLGEDIGYLPGTLDEKFSPWTGPIQDNLDLLIGPENGKDSLGMVGILEMMPFTHVQGSSKHGMYILIDEAQNIEPGVIKMLIERAGDGTKVVLTGDPYQVQHRYLDAVSNGLTHVVQRVMNQPNTGHILLTQGERSPLAEMAADIL